MIEDRSDDVILAWHLLVVERGSAESQGSGLLQDGTDPRHDPQLARSGADAAQLGIWLIDAAAGIE
jgi:hypothetical protein